MYTLFGVTYDSFALWSQLGTDKSLPLSCHTARPISHVVELHGPCLCFQNSSNVAWALVIYSLSKQENKKPTHRMEFDILNGHKVELSDAT